MSSSSESYKRFQNSLMYKLVFNLYFFDSVRGQGSLNRCINFVLNTSSAGQHEKKTKTKKVHMYLFYLVYIHRMYNVIFVIWHLWWIDRLLERFRLQRNMAFKRLVIIWAHWESPLKTTGTGVNILRKINRNVIIAIFSMLLFHELMVHSHWSNPTPRPILIPWNSIVSGSQSVWTLQYSFMQAIYSSVSVSDIITH